MIQSEQEERKKAAERTELRAALFKNIQARLPELEELSESQSGHWGIEDSFYRFYHQSFKVYLLQSETLKIRDTLQSLLPGRPLNGWFEKIIAEGTQKNFELSHNEDWLKHTRPIVEAYFHAQFFLKMICKYGRGVDETGGLPSGWAATLYLYALRY